MLTQADDGGKGLKRTLGAGNLIALGVGAIIGAGLFVRTAAAAGQAAGPAVTLSFIVAAIGCAFAGLCYAEFAAMIPISGRINCHPKTINIITIATFINTIIAFTIADSCVPLINNKVNNNKITNAGAFIMP